MQGIGVSANYWILQTLAMLLTTWIVPNLRVTSIFGALITVVALAFVNAHVWDVALFFEIPDSFTTRSVLLLFCNGTLFWILVKLLPGIEVTGFLPALIAPLVFTVCSLVVAHYGKDFDWQNALTSFIEFMRDTRGFFQTPSNTESFLLIRKSFVVV